MKVFWDQPKQINVGIGRQLVELPAGKPWEMDDDEALARISQGDCAPSDPKEYAAVLKRKGKAQDAQGDAPAGDQGSGTPDPASGGSGRARARTKAPDAPDGGSA